jgi:hypothetical protein
MRMPPTGPQPMKTEATTRGSPAGSWLAFVLLNLLLLQITGCTVELLAPPVALPEGSAAMKQQALSFTPPSGMAGLYIIRPYHFYNDTYYGGGAMLLNISLDYQDFGALETNSYLFAPVPPGKHTLSPGGSFDGLDSSSLAVRFTTEGGRNYYFTATGAGATKFRHLAFDAVSETNGQEFIRKFKLSGDNRFDLQNQPGPTR